MLDALAQAERLPVGARLLERIEGIAIRLVADRMHGDRKTGPCGAADQPGELLAAPGLDPPAPGQARGLRAERARRDGGGDHEPRGGWPGGGREGTRLDSRPPVNSHA